MNERITAFTLPYYISRHRLLKAGSHTLRNGGFRGCRWRPPAHRRVSGRGRHAGCDISQVGGSLPGSWGHGVDGGDAGSTRKLQWEGEGEDRGGGGGGGGGRAEVSLETDGGGVAAPPKHGSARRGPRAEETKGRRGVRERRLAVFVFLFFPRRRRQRRGYFWLER